MPSRWKDFSNWILKLDLFSQEIEILFENNRRTLQTHCGVVFGFIMMFILFAYGGFKTQIMVKYEDVTIMQPDYNNYFDSEFLFDSSYGWKVAFGLTAYDGGLDKEPIDPRFGELKAYQKIWGEKDASGNRKPT